MKKLSQKAEIRQCLEAGGHFTQMDALRFWGCFRLASRINELRRDGMEIKSKTVKTPTGKFVAEYSSEKI